MKQLACGILLIICIIISAGFSKIQFFEKPADKNAKTAEWRADLSGVPSRETIEKLSKNVDTIIKNDQDKVCMAINPRLRKMIFLHFAIYQYMTNQRNIYLNETNINRWAHVFAMLLKESSGDTTNITSMSGKTYTTYQPKSTLQRWRILGSLAKLKELRVDNQTNFGLTQLSVDRLFVTLKLALDPAILKGKESDKINTAIAVRRLIWFYQDFAQGRLTQNSERIRESEKGNPEHFTRFAFGTSMALLLCGSNYMFYEGYYKKSNGAADLADAMSSIAYCTVGSSKRGYGYTANDIKCFAKWATLCPMLNFDIAMLTPLQYFATRNATPVCTGAFKALLIKKPK